MIQNDGPSNITIPEKKLTTCSGCKFYFRRLFKSGRSPEYTNSCTHPDSGQNKFLMFSFKGNLPEPEGGIIITPNWCPYLKPLPNE